MPIRVKCDGCKKTLGVKDHLAGKKIKCPVCQHVVLVTAPPAGGAPQLKAAPAPSGETKPAAATKTLKSLKPTADPTKANGAPIAAPVNGNGTPAKPPAPETIERSTASADEEALSALTDEPPPPVQEESPQTIDFTCPWCDLELHLPIDQGGRQSQCPNEECKRIIKVPMPKVVEKKDWRKMDRKGPAAAIINQPEQLEGAWSAAEATRARQASLAQAGALKEAPKPGIGVFSWLRRGFYVSAFSTLFVLAIIGIGKLHSTSAQVRLVDEVESLIKGNAPKVDRPILRAEVHRTIAMIHLRHGEKKILDARDHFVGARALARVEKDKEALAVNEQLFLIELALEQIELAGTEEEYNLKKRLRWENVRGELATTLGQIIAPEVQVLAMRAVANRLLTLKQHDLAIGLAGGLSNPDPKTRARPPVFAQQIALLFARDELEKLKEIAKPPDLNSKKELDAQVRAGYAEGHARKGDFEEAFKLATHPGPDKDRLQACLAVAAIALQERQHKDQAARFLKECLEFTNRSDATKTSPWHRLELLRLAARTDDLETYLPQLEALNDAFKRRAHLELLRAKCEAAAGRLAPDVLADIEQADMEGTTLALAWITLGQHNARHGGSKDAQRQAFEQRLKTSNPTVSPDLIRPILDIGTYLGSMK